MWPCDKKKSKNVKNKKCGKNKTLVLFVKICEKKIHKSNKINKIEEKKS